MQAQNQSAPAQARHLFDELTKDSKQDHLSQSRREEILGLLKVLGRNADNVHNLYATTGINLLGGYAFGTYPSSTSREALRCIANALLLFPQSRQVFVQNGFAPKAAVALLSQNEADEFLLSRILFLLTYEKSTNIAILVDQYELADGIIAHLHRHTLEGREGGSPFEQAGADALAETLKLLFNVTNSEPEYVGLFSKAIPDLLTVLVSFSVPFPPLQPPLIYVLNALANLDFEPDESGNSTTHINLTFDELAPAVDKLISILDASTQTYQPTQLETQIIPLLTILRKINDASDEQIRDKMCSELLPKDIERDLPLGKSSTIASRLLRLTTSPGLMNLPEAVSAFLFELSDKDASKYVKNVGYGYAAGYLMTHDIPIPESVKENQGVQGLVPINPVTGQRLDKEPRIPPLDMTQAEKEREAERLFVLFERLKKTGVIDAKNPVQQAMEEGRFEELSDSDG